MNNQEISLNISKLTLGTVQLGIPYGINNQLGMPEEQNSFDILSEAWRSGIVSFDTAAAYGQSERILGRFLRGKSPTIITKLQIAPENPGRSTILRVMYEAVEASLQNLELKSIPVLLLHNTDILEQHGEAVTAGFQTLIKDGLIQRAGISVANNTEEEYRSIWRYLQDDTYDAVQLPMNVLDHRPLNNGCLEMLSSAGKHVFVRSVFLQGLICMQEQQLPAYISKAKDLIIRLRMFSDQYGMSLPQMAVSFIRDLEGVHSLVIGAETVEQVRENVQFIEGPPLPEQLRNDIEKQFKYVPEQIITPKLWRN